MIAASLAVPYVLLWWLVASEWGPLMRFDQNVVESWHNAVVDAGHEVVVEVEVHGFRRADCAIGCATFVIPCKGRYTCAPDPPIPASAGMELAPIPARSNERS